MRTKIRPDVVKIKQDQNKDEASSDRDITGLYQEKAGPSQDITGSI